MTGYTTIRGSLRSGGEDAGPKHSVFSAVDGHGIVTVKGFNGVETAVRITSQTDDVRMEMRSSKNTVSTVMTSAGTNGGVDASLRAYHLGANMKVLSDGALGAKTTVETTSTGSSAATKVEILANATSGTAKLLVASKHNNANVGLKTGSGSGEATMQALHCFLGIRFLTVLSQKCNNEVYLF